MLVVGDSLTAVIPGSSYVKLLKRMQNTYSVVAKRRGGDTLLGINRRLKHLLPKYKPQVVVIEAGVNDILLPFLKSRGGKWERSVNRLVKRGSIPTVKTPQFQALYSQTIEMVKQHEVVKLVITTISCLGEDLTNELNKRRDEYNNVIRNFARQYEIQLADVGEVFEAYIKKLNDPSKYLMPDYYNICLDSLYTMIEKFADNLSARRGLNLTIDGVHLNRLGAKIFAETILERLNGQDVS
jgi:lysophospholipase L1-like esterase